MEKMMIDMLRMLLQDNLEVSIVKEDDFVEVTIVFDGETITEDSYMF